MSTGVIVAIIIIVAVLVVLQIAYEVTYRGMLPAADRESQRRETERTGFFDYYFEKNPGTTYKEISFQSDGETLAGIYMEPKSAPLGVIVMTHGMGRTIEHYLPECKHFSDSGFICIMFDGLACGNSTGSGYKGLAQHAIDMDHVLSQVTKDERFNKYPLFLYGHSWGAAAVSIVSNYHVYDVKGLLSLATYDKNIESMKPSIIRRYSNGQAAVIAFLLRRYFRKIFGKNNFYSATQGLKKLDCPIRMYHSDNDSMVPYDLVFKRFQRKLGYKKNIEFITTHKDHNIAEIYEEDVKIRDIMKAMYKAEKAGNPKPELIYDIWNIQLVKDEKMLNEFSDFFKSCL